MKGVLLCFILFYLYIREIVLKEFTNLYNEVYTSKPEKAFDKGIFDLKEPIELIQEVTENFESTFDQSTTLLPNYEDSSELNECLSSWLELNYPIVFVTNAVGDIFKKIFTIFSFPTFEELFESTFLLYQHNFKRFYSFLKDIVCSSKLSGKNTINYLKKLDEIYLEYCKSLMHMAKHFEAYLL